jgi:hypothetical protein
MARSAYNTRKPGSKPGFVIYHIDTGKTVEHHPGDGAVALAKMLLDTIKED